MIEYNDENWSSGRLVRAASKSFGIVTTDCSSWDSDIPADQWSTGKPVSVRQSLPAVKGDFIPAPQPFVEITLKVGPNANPAQALLFTMGMIVKIDGAVPNLGLSYDRSRSRSDNGTVKIALIPINSDEAAARLDEITRMIELELCAFDQFTVQSIRLTQGAA